MSVALATPAVTAGQEVNLTGSLTPEAAQQRTDALCRSAKSLSDREVEPSEARRLYLRAVRTGASETKCAADGLKALADAKTTKEAEEKKASASTATATATAKATGLLAQGYDEEADKVLATLIKEAPTFKVPAELQPVTRGLASAEALAAQGYETEAQELVREALAADPSREVPPALRKGDRKPELLREAIGWAGVGVVTAGILGAAIIVALAIAKVLWSHLRRRIVTEPLLGGSDGTGGAILADMRQRLELWSEGHGSSRLAASAGPTEGLALPANVAGLVPQAGVVMDLLGVVDRLMPGRTWQLTGHLLPAEPERGVGAALTLSRQTGGKILAAETIRQSEFQAVPSASATEEGKALAWQRLALPCAALVLFTDRRLRHLAFTHFERLGTEDWRSFAMATSASTYYKWDLNTARRLYRQAVARDDEYADAQFGLAVVDLRLARGNDAKLLDVEERLHALISNPKLKLDPTRDALWYRAQFWRVVVRIQQGATAQAPLRAEELFDPAKTKWWDPDPPKQLRDFLADAMPKALAVLAGALKLGDTAASDQLAAKLRTTLNLDESAVTGDAIATALSEDRDRRLQAAYNLACYHALNNEDDDWADQSLDHLEIALESGGPDLARFAWDDYALEHLREDMGAKSKFKATLASAGFDPRTYHVAGAVS